LSLPIRSGKRATSDGGTLVRQYVVVSKRGAKEERIPPNEVKRIIDALKGEVPQGTRYSYHQGFFFDPGDRKIWLQLEHTYLPTVEQALMKQFGEIYRVDYG